MVYGKILYKNNISTSFSGMLGWMIWLRVRSCVAANQVAGEASEDFFIFVGQRTELAAVAFHPFFDQRSSGFFIFLASNLVSSLII